MCVCVCVCVCVFCVCVCVFCVCVGGGLRECVAYTYIYTYIQYRHIIDIHTLAFTRYSFTPTPSCTSHSSVYCSLHLLLQQYSTTNEQYMNTPSDPPCDCHTPYNIGNGNIV